MRRYSTQNIFSKSVRCEITSHIDLFVMSEENLRSQEDLLLIRFLNLISSIFRVIYETTHVFNKGFKRKSLW